MKKIIRKTAKFRYYPDKVVKTYRFKYYSQRMHFGGIGEPQILRDYPSDCFVRLLEFGEELKLHSREIEKKKLATYSETATFERLAWPITNKAKLFGKGLHENLLAWLERLPSELERVGIRHRDIQDEHVMWDGETFRLIDFACAVPLDYSLKHFINPKRHDDKRTIETLTKEVSQWTM